MKLTEYISEKLTITNKTIEVNAQTEKFKAIREEHYEEIKPWFEANKMWWRYDWKLNEDFEVVIPSNDFTLTVLEDEVIPDYIQIAPIKGLFTISGKNLKSLRGIPDKVNGDFIIQNCDNLKQLDVMPSEIGGDINIENSGIENLIGIPKSFDGVVNLKSLPNLTSLSGLNDIFNDNLSIKDCENLTTLKDGPKKIHGIITINGCGLTSLEYFPVGARSIYIYNCQELKTLKGAPKEVTRNFYCVNCNGLTNLIGAPEKVGKVFSCSSCDNLESLLGGPKEVYNFICDECPSLTSLEGIKDSVIHNNLDCSDCNIESYKVKPTVNGRIIKK